MPVPDHIESFWRRFLDSAASPPDADELFLEAFQIGATPGEADEGSRLILGGQKTATSSLLWEYEHLGKRVPFEGSLSVVENGDRRPVCVVQTTRVEVVPFAGLDDRFALDYGETDGTAENWYEKFEYYYRDLCQSMGRQLNEETPLVCERFAVVFR